MAKTPTPNDAPSTDSTPNNGGSAPTTPRARAPRQPQQQPQPTEQLPMESAPVAASASASGGATGLETETPKQRSLFRRHPLGTAIVGGAVAVVLVSGLTAWGVGAAVTASLTSSTGAEMPTGTTTTAPTTAPSTAPATGKAKLAGRIAFRATIQSITGDDWTILTKKGKTVTVAVDSATQFGTKRMTATAGSFTVGESVIIVATKGTTGTPTATRVAVAPTAN